MSPGRGLTTPEGPPRIHDVHALGKRRRPHRDAALRIHHEGIAVKHQFILPAYKIDEYQRYARLVYPRVRDFLLTLRLFTDFVRRSVDDQEHLCACARA